VRVLKTRPLVALKADMHFFLLLKWCRTLLRCPGRVKTDLQLVHWRSKVLVMRSPSRKAESLVAQTSKDCYYGLHPFREKSH